MSFAYLSQSPIWKEHFSIGSAPWLRKVWGKVKAQSSSVIGWMRKVKDIDRFRSAEKIESNALFRCPCLWSSYKEAYKENQEKLFLLFSFFISLHERVSKYRYLFLFCNIFDWTYFASFRLRKGQLFEFSFIMVTMWPEECVWFDFSTDRNLSMANANYSQVLLSTIFLSA